jgi:hypothetical protein
MKNHLPSILIGLNAVVLLYLAYSLLSAAGSPSVGMYWALLGLLPILVFGIWARLLPDPAAARAVRRNAPLNGWYELCPSVDPQRERMLDAICAAWNAITCFVLIHFWHRGELPADTPIRVIFYAGCIVYVLVGLSLAAAVLGKRLRGRNALVKHLHVESSRAALILGRSVKLKVEAEFAKGTRPVIVRIGLSCVRLSAQYLLGSPVYLARKCYAEQWSDVIVNQVASTGQRLFLEREFQVPEDAPPSSPQGKVQSPWFLWQVAITVTFADARQYRQTYIVAGDQADAQEKSSPRRRGPLVATA